MHQITSPFPPVHPQNWYILAYRRFIIRKLCNFKWLRNSSLLHQNRNRGINIFWTHKSLILFLWPMSSELIWTYGVSTFCFYSVLNQRPGFLPESFHTVGIQVQWGEYQKLRKATKSLHCSRYYRGKYKTSEYCHRCMAPNPLRTSDSFILNANFCLILTVGI